MTACKVGNQDTCDTLRNVYGICQDHAGSQPGLVIQGTAQSQPSQPCPMCNRRPGSAGKIDANDRKRSGAAFTGLRISLVEEQISYWTQAQGQGQPRPTLSGAVLQSPERIHLPTWQPLPSALALLRNTPSPDTNPTGHHRLPPPESSMEEQRGGIGQGWLHMQFGF